MTARFSNLAPHRPFSLHRGRRGFGGEVCLINGKNVGVKTHHNPNASSPFTQVFCTKQSVTCSCTRQRGRGQQNAHQTRVCVRAPHTYTHGRDTHSVHAHACRVHSIQGTPMLMQDLVKKRTNLTSGNEKFKMKVLHPLLPEITCSTARSLP